MPSFLSPIHLYTRKTINNRTNNIKGTLQNLLMSQQNEQLTVVKVNIIGTCPARYIYKYICIAI